MTLDYDLIIINGIVVTDTSILELDIAIKDEKIAKLVRRGELNDARVAKRIDAEGGYVMVIQSPCSRPDRHLIQCSQEVWMLMSIYKNRRYLEKAQPQITMKPDHDQRSVVARPPW